MSNLDRDCVLSDQLRCVEEWVRLGPHGMDQTGAAPGQRPTTLLLAHLRANPWWTLPDIEAVLQARAEALREEFRLVLATNDQVWFGAANCPRTGRDAENVMKRRLRDWNKVLRVMHRRKAPAGDGWRIEHLLLSWDASSPCGSQRPEAIANHHIPPEVRHFLGQAALMALLSPRRTRRTPSQLLTSPTVSGPSANPTCSTR